jgi:hypothetical protein
MSCLPGLPFFYRRGWRFNILGWRNRWFGWYFSNGSRHINRGHWSFGLNWLSAIKQDFVL